jgi:hypothetical protein
MTRSRFEHTEWSEWEPSEVTDAIVMAGEEARVDGLAGAQAEFRVVEYVRADLVAEQAAEIERLRGKLKECVAARKRLSEENAQLRTNAGPPAWQIRSRRP